ncbi:MAG: sulfatase-like hydrolase/transferase [Pirellulaceae bacterium]
MRSLFVVSCAAYCLLAASLHAADRAPRLPSVLLILADDVGCEPIGCYGGTSHATPRIDRLAAEGMRFDYAHAMPVCHPTRICLLTGRYPFRLNHPGWGSFPKQAESQTIAHVMKQAGYATAVAGKWQLTMMNRDPHHPQRLGFDESCLFGWHEGPRYHDPMIYQNGKVRDDTAGRYGPDVYCEFLIDFMERNRERPFFAFYSMALCHNVTDDLKEPVPFAPSGRYLSYHEMIESMDRQVGVMVDALDRLKLRDNTLILFTGDNGTSKSTIATARDGKYIYEKVVSMKGDEAVPGGKGELTNLGTNVPLIANWPSTIESGQVVDDLVDMSDYFATLAELGEGKTPAGVEIDGRSFLPRLHGASKAAREWAFAEGRGGGHFVRTQDWKLYNDGRLIDMQNDPREKRPLAEGEGGADAAAARKQLQAALDRLAAGG